MGRIQTQRGHNTEKPVRGLAGRAMGAGDELPERGSREVFVPGRLCVIGEHTDWAAGYRDQNRGIPPGFTLVATTREGLYARVGARTDGRLVFKARTAPCRMGARATAAAIDAPAVIPPLDVAMTEEALQGVIDAKDFYIYVAGTALVVCSRFGLFSLSGGNGCDGGDGDGGGGVTIDNHLTTLPLKKGLSSSAAVCVLVVRSLCLAYGLELTVQQVMELAHLGEGRAGSKCGRMDQCCALGTNHVAAMFFDGEDVQMYEIAPPECGIFLVVADLNGSKDTIKMLACLNECFPHTKDENEERAHRYVRDNTALAWKAVSAIERGDAEDLGRAMTEAQENFDACAIPICPSEFSSPLLHAVMSDVRVKNLTWGIKGVGAQGDGSVQMLARGNEEQAELTRLLLEMGMSCVLPVTVTRPARKQRDTRSPATPTITAATPTTPGHSAGGRGGAISASAGGARARSSPPDVPRMLHPRRVRSAVIVAAGLSTRMFPASVVVKKELFPIVDHDGVCKPVILAIMEGLVESGIDRFVVVVQRRDIKVFDGFFSMEAVQGHKHRLSPAQRAYCARIEGLRRKITYAVQEKQQGFGHAVYCARHALGISDCCRVQKSPSGASNGNGAGVASVGGDKAGGNVRSYAHKHGENGNGGGLELGSEGGECGGLPATGAGVESGEEEESFLLVLGDHLYRRGGGTTRACASQLIHAFLKHGEVGKPAIGLKVMRESSVSPYGVAAGECVEYPCAGTVDERCDRAGLLSKVAVDTVASAAAATAAPPVGSAETGRGVKSVPPPLGGRVYRLTKLVEKPTSEFARENLVTPGLGPTDDGEGRHLVVFGQYVLPARRTFDILAEDIELDRRQRGEFQLTSVLDRMRREDEGMLGCTIRGDALDAGIPAPYVSSMGSFAKPQHA